MIRHHTGEGSGAMERRHEAIGGPADRLDPENAPRPISCVLAIAAHTLWYGRRRLRPGHGAAFSPEPTLSGSAEITRCGTWSASAQGKTITLQPDRRSEDPRIRPAGGARPRGAPGHLDRAEVVGPGADRGDRLCSIAAAGGFGLTSTRWRVDTADVLNLGLNPHCLQWAHARPVRTSCTAFEGSREAPAASLRRNTGCGAGRSHTGGAHREHSNRAAG